MQVKRPAYGEKPEPPQRTGTTIQGFSRKSRARLRFAAINSRRPLISQFVGTYHDTWPISGHEIKKQLDAFLQVIRRRLPGEDYLWVLEFQRRGAPHFHIFLTAEHSSSLHIDLAEAWHRIAGFGSPHHLWWHRDRVESNGQTAFIPWDMGKGAYVAKYLDKEHQKAIPNGFRWTGAWWRCTRGMVAIPTEYQLEQMEQDLEPDTDSETGETRGIDAPVKYIMRALGKYSEKVNKRSWFRRTSRSITILTGAPVFRRLLNHVKGELYEPSPF